MNGDLKGVTQTSHLVIKAKKPNLTTSLMVTTNRRSYRLRLVSSSIFHMPYVGFEYPDTVQHEAEEKYLADIAEREAEKVTRAAELEKQRLAELKNLEARRLARQKEIEDEKVLRILELEKELAEKNKALEAKKFAAKRLANPLHLDFSYRVKRSKGRPSWVPRQVYNDGRKTYVVMPPGMNTEEAPILLIKGAEQREIVNYRIVDNKYVVDRIFGEAVLVSGVGWKRQEVAISRIRK